MFPFFKETNMVKGNPVWLSLIDMAMHIRIAVTCNMVSKGLTHSHGPMDFLSNLKCFLVELMVEFPLQMICAVSSR